MSDDKVPLRIDGRQYGYVNHSSKEYETHREWEPHWCRKHDAFGIDEGVIEYLEVRGIEDVRLTLEKDGEPEAEYVVPLEVWRDASILDVLHPDFGKQLFLTTDQLEEFEVSES